MKAVVLAGGQDIGNCPLSMVRPRVLFPLVNEVLLEHALRTIRHTRIKEAAVCSNGKTSPISSFLADHPVARLSVSYSEDRLPRGAAGCLRDAADLLVDGPFLVIEGNLFIHGDFGELIAEHRRRGAALTVGVVPIDNWHSGDGEKCLASNLAPLGVYVVEPSVLDSVPAFGYWDMKEQLIPKLTKRGLPLSFIPFHARHRRVADAASYASVVQEILSGVFGAASFTGLRKIAPDVWVGTNVHVSPTAKLVGPLVLEDDVVVGDRAAVRGPSIIGERTVIEDEAIVAQTIVWTDAKIGARATVDGSIVTDGFRVRAFGRLLNSIAIDRSLKVGEVHGLMQRGYDVNPMSRFVPNFLGSLFS